MKIYLAARFALKDKMREYADVLKEDGFEITSTWNYGGEDDLTMSEIAKLDETDVERADILVCFSEPFGSANTGGGRHTEVGMALALGKTVIICGPLEQVFHWHPDVINFPSFELVRRFLTHASEEKILS